MCAKIKYESIEKPRESFVQRFKKNWNRAEIGTQASNLSYTTVLSLVPFLAVFLMFAKFFGQLYGWTENLKKMILQYATLGTAQDFAQGLDAAIERLSFENVGWFGLAATLFTTMIMLNTISVTLQKVAGVSEQRSWTKRLIIYISIVILGPVGCAALLAFTTSRYSVIGLFLSSWALATFYLCALLFLIYKFVPNRHFNTWFTLGAATLTSIALMILQAGFTWSSQNLLNYNQVYGSLASFPLFLLWLYLVWYTILLGAILVATLTPMGEDKTQKHFLKIETLRPPH